MNENQAFNRYANCSDAERVKFDRYIKTQMNLRLKQISEMKESFPYSYLIKDSGIIETIYPEQFQKLIDAELELLEKWFHNEVEKFQNG